MCCVVFNKKIPMDFRKMFWFLIIIGTCMPCWNAELTACNEDSHCAVDYYCELDAYSCRQCLRCEDYQRNPPAVPTVCVKSVVECGACLQTKNHRSSYECGTNTNVLNHKMEVIESKEIRLPMYAWVLLVLIVAVVVIGGATLILFVNRVTYTAVSRSDSQIPPGATDHLENTWSAPPAYNTVVDIPSANVQEEPTCNEKPVLPVPPDKARESADRQATQPYNPPNYVRGPRLSPIHTPDLTINNAEDRNSVDGVIAVRSPVMSIEEAALPIETVSNLAVEEGSNISNNGNYQQIEPPLSNGSGDPTRSGQPVVVVNNNVHLQSVTLSGANIFLPRSSVVERR